MIAPGEQAPQFLLPDTSGVEHGVDAAAATERSLPWRMRSASRGFT